VSYVTSDGVKPLCACVVVFESVAWSRATDSDDDDTTGRDATSWSEQCVGDWAIKRLIRVQRLRQMSST